MNNFKRVCCLISQITGRSMTEIKPSDSLFEDLEMDSVMCIELIIELEKEAIFLNDDVIKPSLTVSELVNIISSQN
ncbi:acyl carrier protein [Hafnia paralvei]|uniref:acyl carrier protein n=1 Tax=Hafnia paralvei TaxID=546367 RepID=UPI00300C7ABF